MKPENNSDSNQTEAEVSEQQGKAATEKFKDLPNNTPAKTPFFKKTGVRVAGAVLVITALLGGTVYELASHGIIDVPGVQQSADFPSIFNNELNTQNIKAGVNAVPITR